MKKQLIEVSCDVCGRTDTHDKAAFVNCPLPGWLHLDRHQASVHDTLLAKDFCSPRCLHEFVEREWGALIAAQKAKDGG